MFNDKESRKNPGFFICFIFFKVCGNISQNERFQTAS